MSQILDLVVKLSPAFIALGSVMSALGIWYSRGVAKRTLKLHESSKAPNVVVRAVLDRNASTLIYIIIENIGGSFAYDVQFSSERFVPRAFGIEGLEGDKVEIVQGPLWSGIPALAPGDFRRILWGQYGGLHDVLGDEHIEISVSYKDNAEKPHSDKCALEVVSFQYSDISDNRPEKRIGDVLEKVEQQFRRICDSDSVVIKSSATRRRERDHFIELCKQKQAEKADKTVS